MNDINNTITKTYSVLPELFNKVKRKAAGVPISRIIQILFGKYLSGEVKINSDDFNTREEKNE